MCPAIARVPSSISSFRPAVLLAADLGDDADTTAAITGQLAGVLEGASGIPADWLAKLAREATSERSAARPPPPRPPASTASGDAISLARTCKFLPALSWHRRRKAGDVAEVSNKVELVSAGRGYRKTGIHHHDKPDYLGQRYEVAKRAGRFVWPWHPPRLPALL